MLTVHSSPPPRKGPTSLRLGVISTPSLPVFFTLPTTVLGIDSPVKSPCNRLSRELWRCSPTEYKEPALKSKPHIPRRSVRHTLSDGLFYYLARLCWSRARLIPYRHCYNLYRHRFLCHQALDLSSRRPFPRHSFVSFHSYIPCVCASHCPLLIVFSPFCVLAPLCSRPLFDSVTFVSSPTPSFLFEMLRHYPVYDILSHVRFYLRVFPHVVSMSTPTPLCSASLLVELASVYQEALAPPVGGAALPTTPKSRWKVP